MDKWIKTVFFTIILMVFFGCSRDKKQYQQLESRISLVNNTKYAEYETYLKDADELKKDLQKFVDKYPKSNYYMEVQRELEKTNSLISKITAEKAEFDSLGKLVKDKYTLEEAEKELTKFRGFLGKYPNSIKAGQCNDRVLALNLIIFDLKTGKETVMSIKELDSLIKLCAEYEKLYAGKEAVIKEIREKKSKLESQRGIVFDREMKEAFKMQDNDARARLEELLHEKFTWGEKMFNTSVTVDFMGSQIAGQGTEKTVTYKYKVRAKFLIGKKEYVYTAKYHMVADDLAGVQYNSFLEHGIE